MQAAHTNATRMSMQYFQLDPHADSQRWMAQTQTVCCNNTVTCVCHQGSDLLSLSAYAFIVTANQCGWVVTELSWELK